MRLYLLITILLFSFSILANDNQKSSRALLGSVSTALFNANQQISGDGQPLIRNVSHHYISEVGAFFIVDFSSTLTSWYSQQDAELPKSEAVEKAKKAFANIRQSAKHMAHQIYSIERQLSQFSKADKATLPEETSEKAASMKEKLLALKQQKRQLNAQYHQLQKNYHDVVSKERANAFYSSFENSFFEQVCLNESFTRWFDDNHGQAVSIVLKGAAQEKENTTSDINLYLKGDIVAKCHQSRLIKSEFIKHIQYSYF
jgi:hypothetical protein